MNMRWIIRIYALVLLAYTGWRTYDFMVNQLPAGDTSTILALLFLFATELGLILWHEVSINHSTTREQHGVSTGLTWIDFVGSLGAGLADMILRQTFYGGYEIPPLLALMLLYGLPAIVALNVAGVMLYLANDSETQIDQAKKRLRFEITRQAIRELNENKANIAEGLKKDIYRELRDDVTGKIEREYIKNKAAGKGAGLAAIPSGTSAPSNNGRGKETVTFNAEVDSLDPTRKAR